MRAINQLLNESFDKINLLADTSKVLGTPLKLDEKKTLIPISKVSYGFALGGGDKNNKSDPLYKEEVSPFLGGSLGGVNITPIGFIIFDQENYSFTKIDKDNSLFDELLDIALAIIKKGNKKTQ